MIVKEWYADGKIKCLKNTDEDGILDGEYREWNENGSLHLHYNYKNGILSGQQTTYDCKGSFISTEVFTDGKNNNGGNSSAMDGLIAGDLYTKQGNSFIRLGTIIQHSISSSGNGNPDTGEIKYLLGNSQLTPVRQIGSRSSSETIRQLIGGI